MHVTSSHRRAWEKLSRGGDVCNFQPQKALGKAASSQAGVPGSLVCFSQLLFRCEGDVGLLRGSGLAGIRVLSALAACRRMCRHLCHAWISFLSLPG